MQSVALDENGKAFSAWDAVKGKNYFCLSCRGLVRRRGGNWVRDHFYHLQENLSCHLSQKSETHLFVQSLLQNCLPPGESRLEERFPMIGRIADVAWFRHRIVFEFQYSPIAVSELEGRLNDYRSIGWQVIWILHTHSFFKEKASREELFLESHPHYFSNHHPSGTGSFFDVIWQGLRSPAVKDGVELHHPFLTPQPLQGNHQRKGRSLYFKNDFIDEHLSGHFSFEEPKIKPLSFRDYASSAMELLLESVFS